MVSNMPFPLKTNLLFFKGTLLILHEELVRLLKRLEIGGHSKPPILMELPVQLRTVQKCLAELVIVEGSSEICVNNVRVN